MLERAQLLVALLWHLFSLLFAGFPMALRCCLSVSDLLLFYHLTFQRQVFSAVLAPTTTLAPVAVPPIAMGLPPGFAMPEFHGGRLPAGLPLVVGRRFAPPVEVGADPSPSACVSAFTLNLGSDGLRRFHAPVGFDDLHHMFINPGALLEFLMYDQGGSPLPESQSVCHGAGQRHSLVR